MLPKMRRLILTPFRHLCRMALRIIITGLIVMACLMVVSRSLGLPVPGPSELLDKFKNVSQLADILS
ncbi:MAG: hypothetical protein QOH25_1024 [Acidobacteriota bacterium]|jgi:hypothetical protein|nr:hypothetical protein [Acidobacteriota bacterium]